MRKTRVIPLLLLRGRGLVKTVKFKQPKYIGDPINTVRIFNDKEVDEVVFLDISATAEGRPPDFELLSEIAGEAFMPMAYGGGIRSVEDIRTVLSMGFEKIVVNSAAYSAPEFLRQAADMFGSQSIVACVDVRRTMFGGYELYSRAGSSRQKPELLDHMRTVERMGAGEIIVQSIDRDGTRTGYDLNLISRVAAAVTVPVVAAGGASSVNDFATAVNEAKASAVAAGSMFVYVGRHQAVLINYPSRSELDGALC